MNLSQLLLILRARWRSALIVFAMTVAIVAAFTATRSKTFVATAAVVLDVKSPDPIAGIVLPGMNVSSYMATQVDVLQSERVMLRAVKALRIDEKAGLRAGVAGTDGRQRRFQRLAGRRAGPKARSETGQGLERHSGVLHGPRSQVRCQSRQRGGRGLHRNFTRVAHRASEAVQCLVRREHQGAA
ncbi:MAG: hypothetical protein V9G29_03920 [Burkholderiaceae bacterium]